jgi:spermidine/putrescine transport system permease protein
VFYAFLYVPIAVMVVLSFNDSQIMGFPLKGFTLRSYGDAFTEGDLPGALFNSFAVGIGAALIATVLALPYGLSTAVLAAHVTWVLPFAFLTLYPRLHRFDRSIEEAAMDLGATPWVVFRRVILPLIRPALIATLLFSFTLSFDEFIRTLFVVGSQRTTPVYLWLLISDQMAPYLPAVGVMIMLISIVVAGIGFWVSGRAARLAGRVES